MKKLHALLILLLLFQVVLAQQQTITGTVYDQESTPIPSATVKVKGTNKQVLTDANGQFSIDVLSSDDILVFSFIGFIEAEKSVPTNNQLIVTLQEESKGLDEVVVIGYGTVSRKDLAGAVSSIKGKELEKAPVMNVAEALTGRLPGVQVTTVDGAPGAEVVIRVRGGGSITQDNSPLYIVDGFIVDNINNISATDIESIDVLKDASSTAIYGSKGANGVVIVTTKTPKEGRTSIGYNNFFQNKYIPKELGVLSPYEFALLHYEHGRVRGTTSSEYTNFQKFFGEYDDLELYKYQAGTNWQNELFGGAIRSNQHNLSISGGTEKTKVGFNTTYNDDEGLMLNSGQKRYYFNFKLNHELYKNLKLDLSARYTNEVIDGAGTSGSSSVRISDGIQTRPINGLADYLIIDPVDMIGGDQDDYDNFLRSLINPIELTKQDYRQRTNRDFSLGAALNYSPSKKLNLRSEAAISLRNGNNKRYWGPLTGESRNVGLNLPLGQIELSNADRYRFVNTADYKALKNKRHDLSVLLGHEISFTTGRTQLNRAKYFDENVSPETMFANMALGTPERMETYEARGEDFVSFFGRVSYSFLDRYVLYGTLRADGSSKFAPGKRWGYFPSASFAWKIKEESFMQDVSFVDDLKLRLSYGEAGNNRLRNDSWRFLFVPSQNRPYGAGDINQVYYTYLNSALANPGLQWETTISRNLGLDFSLFNNRLTAVIDIYKNTTKDLIIDNEIPSYLGFTSQFINMGQTSNQGFEIGLNAPIVEKPDYGVSVSFNIGRNVPKIDKLDGNDRRILQSNWAGTDLKTQDDFLFNVGETIGQVYGYVADGFYTVNDFESYNGGSSYTLKDGIASSQGILGGTIGIRPGTMKLKDLNGDGQITADGDRQVIGNTLPKHAGGFGVNARYKNFDLSTFFNWVYGNDIYNSGRIQYNMLYRTNFGNISDRMNSQDRFKYTDAEGQLVTGLNELAELNKNAKIWSPFSMGGASPVLTTDAIEDGSFLRLSLITLGYTLPRHLTSRVGVSTLRIFGTVYNAFVWTSYSGYDPEVSTTRSSSYAALTPGVDYSAYPKSRTFTVGLNINFK